MKCSRVNHMVTHNFVIRRNTTTLEKMYGLYKNNMSKITYIIPTMNRPSLSTRYYLRMQMLG